MVDYLHLLQRGSADNLHTEVSEMSRRLKLMAEQLDVLVVVLAPLDRGPEQRQDKSPVVSDLRESGVSEQDADMGILIHREDVYEKRSPLVGEVRLIVGLHAAGIPVTCRWIDP
ncbi:DnaB-like helicase C-terminal domain-containing protein [Streptomyces sp. NPDC127049]|uniref:DnaB-like helicase C-terminal domain-containing protein n=1 Tax=Streptomyces sp. NPDC127049 TaxID=3347118 RepID=UPI00364D0BFA